MFYCAASVLKTKTVEEAVVTDEISFYKLISFEPKIFIFTLVSSIRTFIGKTCKDVIHSSVAKSATKSHRSSLVQC